MSVAPKDGANKSASVPGWGLRNQVEELRGKYHLMKKDADAYRERSKAKIKQNDRVIQELRQITKTKRISLAEDDNGDERVIKAVFSDARNERLSLQSFTASEAIDEMGQHVCEAEKLRSYMQFEREKRECKLVELKQELDRMHHLELASPEQQQAEQRVTSLENGLDKALIKYDTARIICRKYQDILENLNKESLCLPAKLDTMEQTLLQQKMALRELKALAKNAQKTRDEAKKDLSKVEQETYDARRQRDAELTALRKEVERRQADSEKVDKRQNRATLITDYGDQKLALEIQQKREIQKKVLSHEEAYKKITGATHVTDIEEIVERVVSQEKTGEQLRGQVQDLEGQRKRLRNEVQKLTKDYHFMKYTGETKLSKGEKMLEEMQDHTEAEERRNVKALEHLERNGNTLIHVRTGLNNLLEKMDEIKLRPPYHNYTQGDVFDHMKLYSLKMDRLLTELTGDQIGQQQPGQVTLTEEITQKMQTPEFQDFLETQLSPDNVRVRMQASETQLSEFDYDAQENEVLGRVDIKKMGEKLVESKQKPKKRRSKK